MYRTRALAANLAACVHSHTICEDIDSLFHRSQVALCKYLKRSCNPIYSDAKSSLRVRRVCRQMRAGLSTAPAHHLIRLQHTKAL